MLELCVFTKSAVFDLLDSIIAQIYEVDLDEFSAESRSNDRESVVVHYQSVKSLRPSESVVVHARDPISGQ